MKKIRYCIYSLSDPVTGKVRYVGWSTNPLSRLDRHLWKARRTGGGSRTGCSRWIRSLHAKRLTPVFEILELNGSEKRWIEILKPDLNISNGVGPSDTEGCDARTFCGEWIDILGKYWAPWAAGVLAAAVKS